MAIRRYAVGDAQSIERVQLRLTSVSGHVAKQPSATGRYLGTTTSLNARIDLGILGLANAQRPERDALQVVLCTAQQSLLRIRKWNGISESNLECLNDDPDSILKELGRNQGGV